MVLSQFLVEADVALCIIVGKDGSNSTQEDGDPLVSTGESMVKVLKNSHVLTVLFERLEGLGHVVLCPWLIDVREKGFLVNPVVIGQADEALDWFTRLLGCLNSRALIRALAELWQPLPLLGNSFDSGHWLSYCVHLFVDNEEMDRL